MCSSVFASGLFCAREFVSRNFMLKESLTEAEKSPRRESIHAQVCSSLPTDPTDEHMWIFEQELAEKIKHDYMYDEHRFVTPDGLVTLGGNRKKVNAVLTRFNELDLKIRRIKLRRSRPARPRRASSRRGLPLSQWQAAAGSGSSAC
jgi:hypothetical protein